MKKYLQNLTVVIALFFCPFAVLGNDAQKLNWLKSDEIISIDGEIEKAKELAEAENNKHELNENFIVSSLLVAKAKYRRDNSIQGSTEIARAAEKNLRQNSQTTTAASAIAYSVLLADALILQGKTEDAANRLQETLARNYPNALKINPKKPTPQDDAAVRLLRRLADANLELAFDSSGEQQKNYFSQAAGFYLSAAAGSFVEDENDKHHAPPKKILNKIALTNESLKLLGLKLNIPDIYLIDKDVGVYELADKLIKRKLYSAALKVCQANVDIKIIAPKKIIAFAGLNRGDDAIEFLKKEGGELKGVGGFAAATLEAVKLLVDLKSETQAHELLNVFSTVFPEHKQAPTASLKYAAFLQQQGNTIEAANAYRKTGERFKKEKGVAPQAFFAAAVLSQQLNNNNEVIKNVTLLESLPYINIDDNSLTNLKLSASLLASSALLKIANNTQEKNSKNKHAAAAIERARIVANSDSASLKEQAIATGFQAAIVAQDKNAALEFLNLQINLPDDNDKKTAQSFCAILIKHFDNHQDADGLAQLTTVILLSTIKNKLRLASAALPLAAKAVNKDNGNVNDVEKNVFKNAVKMATDEKGYTGTQLLAIIEATQKLLPQPKDNAPYIMLAIENNPIKNLPMRQSVKSKLYYYAAISAKVLKDQQHELLWLNAALNLPKTFNRSELLLQRAVLFVQLEQIEKAEKDFGAAMLSSNKANITAAASRGLAEIHFSQQNWKKAAAAASLALPMAKMNPDNNDVKKCVAIAATSYLNADDKVNATKIANVYIQNFKDGEDIELMEKYITANHTTQRDNK